MVFYGTEHSQDPNHSKFNDIENRFKKFIAKFGANKVEIAVETSIPQESLYREELIRKYRESGFLKFLSDQYGVNIFCPEPKEKIIPLLLSFTKAKPAEVERWILLNQDLNSKKTQKLLEPVGSTVYNKISSDFRNVRDRYIAQGILNVLDKGRSVFAVFGTNHTVAQEPVFTDFFETLKS